MKRIPGPLGPGQIVRAMRAFQRSLPHGLTHLQQTYGDLCAFGIGPSRTVFLVGPEANALVLRNPENFVFSGAYEMLRPIAGDTALVVTDGAPHDRRRRAALPAFHRDGMERGIGLIIDRVEETIGGWRPGRRLDIYQELRQAVRVAMVRAFCGDRVADQMTELARELDQIHELMDYPLPRQLVAWQVPGRARNRAFAGIAAVERRIYQEITRRRREEGDGTSGAISGDATSGDGTSGNGTSGDDLISVMLAARADDGSRMTDQEIRDMVVSSLIAGYDPVSSGIGWAVYHMLRTPGVWEAVREEADRVVGDAPLTVSHVRRLHLLNRVVFESLRLHPPVMMSPRRCVKGFEYEGYTVPAGTLVAVSQYLTHRSPKVWDEPEEFRPERWDREANGGRMPTPFEYLPFGYGPRRCIGGNVAQSVIPAALARLVQRTTLELLTHHPQPAGIPALHPKGGLHVRVTAAASPVPVA